MLLLQNLMHWLPPLSPAAAVTPCSCCCRSTINNCNGKGSCSLDGCIPDLLQYSCVTPFTNKLSENVVYVFGGSRRSQQGSFSCPQDYVAKLKRAEYGAGFTVTEVSAQLSMACFGRVCTFDITRITPYNIRNTLLAVVECVCGPGGRMSVQHCAWGVWICHLAVSCLQRHSVLVLASNNGQAVLSFPG
jgi:hypothetical protein